MISNISEVPPNWIKVRFDEIAENITDRIDKPNESGLEYYIGLEHIDTDQIRIKRFGSTEDVKATKFLCKKGDIIFGKRRSYLRKVAVTDRDAVVSAHSMVIRPKGDLIVPEFLPCFMQSSIFWKTAHAISEGSMSPTIKWKTLAKQEFWIPTIEEQKKTSQVLLSVEKNITKNEKLIEYAEKLKKEFLQELLTRGIDHTNFKTTEIGVFPAEWDVVKIKDICENLDNKRIPITKSKRIEGNIPYYGATGVIDYVNDFTFDEQLLLIGEDGANWTAFANTSYIITGKTWVNNHAHVLKCKRVNIFFLKEYFNYADLSPYISGTTRGKLTKNDLMNIKIPLPNAVEQNAIENIFKSIDNSLAKYTENLDIASKNKKKLTNNFISGKLLIPKEVL